MSFGNSQMYILKKDFFLKEINCCPVFNIYGQSVVYGLNRYSGVFDTRILINYIDLFTRLELLGNTPDHGSNSFCKEPKPQPSLPSAKDLTKSVINAELIYKSRQSE